jgi:hypothetical protein
MRCLPRISFLYHLCSCFFRFTRYAQLTFYFPFDPFRQDSLNQRRETEDFPISWCRPNVLHSNIALPNHLN